MPPLRGSWARCSEGLRHPHTGEIRPITFDHSVAGGRDDVVLAHLNHRLVQMCLRRLRSEIWSQQGQQRLHRVTARLVPDRALDTPAVVAHARLVVLGGDNYRLHEEILTAGGLIREGRFSRLNVGQTQGALEAGLPDLAPASVQETLAALWPRLAEPLFSSLEARVRDRTDGLQKLLEDRADRETGDMTTLMQELERNIREELTQPPNPQLQLWTEPEREQLERNRACLEARLCRIPEEIARETEAIRARYANPTARLFPAAVTFLVPEKLAR
jgi:hypothetical protein